MRAQWGLFDVFLTRAAFVNYPNVHHQRRECDFGAARRAGHNLISILDPSIRSIVDHNYNVQHQSREHNLQSDFDPSMNLIFDHNLEIRVP